MMVSIAFILVAAATWMERMNQGIVTTWEYRRQHDQVLLSGGWQSRREDVTLHINMAVTYESRHGILRI